MRMLPSLPFVRPGLVLLSCAVFLPVAADDTVVLQDSSQLFGRLRETGGVWVELISSSGRRKLLKKDIESVVFDETRRAATTVDKDFVIRRDQHKIYGEVKLLLGGEQIQVTLPSGSRVTLSAKDVLRVVKKGDSFGEEDGVYTVEFRKMLDAALAELDAESDGERESAERRLVSYGILAIQAVRDAQGTVKSDRAREALVRVERAYRLRQVVAPVIERNAPRVFEILEKSSGPLTSMAQEKRDLLLFIFPKYTEQAVPLARFLALDPSQEGELRGWCIEFLRRLQKNRELVNIYKRSVGQAQLAAAIALGRNQILIGVPTLLEALSMESKEIRELAATSLRDISGRAFRFRADGAPAARREAVLRWESWWKANEERLVVAGEKLVRADGSETEERQLARKMWKEASVLLADNRPQEALLLLNRCIETDPNFFPGQLSLAVLYYARLEQPGKALVVLENVVNRQIPGVSYADQGWGFLHLGHARLLTGDLTGALEAYSGCLTRQPRNARALLASSRTELRIVDGTEDLSAEERLSRLRKIRDELRDALDLLDEKSSELTPLAADDLPLTEELPFDRRAHNRAVFDIRRSYRLDRATAAFVLAKLESRIGKLPEAVRDLETVVREVGSEEGEDWRELEVEIRTFLGVLYEGDNRPNLALRQFRTVLQNLDPRDLECQRGMERLRSRSRPEDQDSTGN